LSLWGVGPCTRRSINFLASWQFMAVVRPIRMYRRGLSPALRRPQATSTTTLRSSRGAEKVAGDSGRFSGLFAAKGGGSAQPFTLVTHPTSNPSLSPFQRASPAEASPLKRAEQRRVFSYRDQPSKGCPVAPALPGKDR
jgi:hypothetical protein